MNFYIKSFKNSYIPWGMFATFAFFSAGCAPILINPLCATVNTKTFQQGKGTRSDPYLICSVAHWQNMGTSLSSSFKLGKDLDFTGLTYTPIGSGSTFTGTLDGGNYTVSNVTITGSGSLGLFGDVTGTISNLRILNPTVSGTTFVGALASFLTTGAVVSGITVTGASITGTGDYVGGVIGAMNSSAILKNSTATGTITGANNVGGITGVLARLVATCGTVSGTSSSGTITGVDNVGGITGATDSYCTLTTSSSSANVSGANYVGGVVGYSLGTTMTSVSSTGTVSGAIYSAGVVGYSDGATISKCSHTTGAVSGTVTMVGGIVAGFVSGSMTDCYFRSATISTAGGTNAGGIVAAALAGSITFTYTSPTSVTAGGGGANAVVSQDFSGGVVIHDTNVLYNTTTAGAGSDGVALTTAQIMDPANFSAAGYDTSIWDLSFTSGTSFPSLK